MRSLRWFDYILGCVLRFIPVISNHREENIQYRGVTPMASYENTLKTAKAIGASNVDDAQHMALLCDGPLQTLCGAVAPNLVWEGAQKKGLTTSELAEMAATRPMDVAELMWV
jgi:hypothetical protein